MTAKVADERSKGFPVTTSTVFEVKAVQARQSDQPQKKKVYSGLQGSRHMEQHDRPTTKHTLNPDNAKPTCRFDYAKDLCKDYNETGYCVFGDTCIFLHDRGHYKSGWELELEWTEKLKQSSKPKVTAQPTTITPESTMCSCCSQPFSRPVLAECGHKFCETCALDTFKTQGQCPQCKKIWAGSFKTVH